MIGTQRSIRKKFILVVGLAIIVAQSVVASVAVWQEAQLYARAKQDTLRATAQAVAAAVARPAADGDAAGAFRALRAIGSIPGASYVRVEDASGRALAESGQTEQLESDAVSIGHYQEVDPLRLIGARTLEVDAPVIESGVPIGRLVLVGDISDLRGRLIDVLKFTALGSAAALAIAVLVALRMLGPMTRPLTDLAGAMSRIGKSHDYAVEMRSDRKDEIGVLVRGFDKMIGDIRQRNEELARHREKLEQEVADRTADYRAAMETAEQANRAKSDFLATMSHEIRTPMNGVLVMAELLAASELPPAARKNADVIVRSGQTLLAIINDILDFSKIEAGKLEVEKLAVDPVESAEDVMRLFGDRAQSKGLDLAGVVRLPRGVKVEADPVRLNQVLSNLVNNALKFTERGGVSVEIGPDPDVEGRVRFCVADTGIGIPEDKLAGIFDAFTQADQSTTRKFGGTGLGLAISRQLAAAMGGELRVDSAAGAGARFFFSLPLSAESSSLAPPALPADAPERRAVLCVSGDATRAHLAFALWDAGFDVVACEPDALAREAVGARAVFADLALLAAAPRLPVAEGGSVVAVAGLGEPADRALADRLVDAIAQRPLAKSETDAVIDAIVEGRSLVVKASVQARNTLPRFPNARVLVVDDSAVNREVATEALARLGIVPDVLSDGRQAVDRLDQRFYDLVLMDGSMPELDGYEATRVVRAREAETGRARATIVALTAHVIGAGATAWRDSGMDGVLHKPFTLAAMAACLSEHLTGLARAAEAAIFEPATPTIPAPSGGPIDAAVIAGLREMSGGSNAAVERIVNLYASHAPRSVEAIEAAFAKGDQEELAAAAHALKSMSANIGAVEVAAAAQAIERACRLEHRLPEAEGVAKMSGLVRAACEAVQALAGAPASQEAQKVA